MEKEIWKDITGYEGKYMVSDQGRVKSLKYNNTNKEKILKPSYHCNGYLIVSLCKDNKPKCIKVHQLVAMEFLGHTPCGMKVVVDHIDNNKTNNNLNNLQLISQRENSSKDRKGGSSEYVGVSWRKDSCKWRSMIRINGKKKHLGFFTNELDASEAYQKALKNLS